MEIAAQMVSRLREQTGAGMMDCKRALTESGGDIEKARDILRAKGQADLAKRAGRAAADGVLATAHGAQAWSLVELNSETDFVARNEEFRALAQELADLAARTDAGAVDDLLGAETTAGVPARQRLHDVVAKLRENIVFRRFVRYQKTPGSVLASYVHRVDHKTGVLLELEGDPTNPDQAELARHIAMHIAAAKPQYVRREDVPSEIVEREREVLAEKTRNEGKPEAAIPKIVEGRIGKFYEQICLVDQPYVRDQAHKIGDLLKQAGATARRFTLYVVGQD